MAVASPTSDPDTAAATAKAPAMESPSSRLSSTFFDAAAAVAAAVSSSAAMDSSSTSSSAISSSAATPDRDDPSNFSPSAEIQSPTLLKSEEYRQLFRLPPEEILVEDFNCAFQENLLIQGHMYLFVHYICFYSNIFGFETKKLIPFHEVTGVRRAKTAGIFPNAIEIFTGPKKYFFASFLSRDEAFKLIHDGWMAHSNGASAVIEQQEPIPVTSIQENGIAIEKVNSFKFSIDDLDSSGRNINIDNPTQNDPEVPTNVEDMMVSATLAEVKDNNEEDIIVVPNPNSSSSTTLLWKEENREAPKIPEGYTLVAESRLPVKVEDFFNFFFSDNAIDFIDSFHQRCGDKEFKCHNKWQPHETYGHTRDVSFQHPIKIYFGAKFGGCLETQKFRLYRNSHLVVETSQEVSDVPYSDYFRVEALWDVERDADESRESCFLRVYVNVAFLKRTVWKGKIVQSTLEECREAYALWINMAQEFLKKKLENTEEKNSVTAVVTNSEIRTEIVEEKNSVSSETLFKSREERFRKKNISNPVGVNQQVGNLEPVDSSSFGSLFGGFVTRFSSSLKSQGNLSLIIVVIFLVILLMQLSILALLARPQHVHLQSPADYLMNTAGEAGSRSSEAVVWLEKRVHHLKDEMYMVEARLERMRNEYSLLKLQLDDLNRSLKP